MKMLGTINASNKNHSAHPVPVSDIDLWEQPGSGLKVFSSSHDGYWRVWNATQNMSQEMEQKMSGGKVECVKVASDFLFVGSEGPHAAIPDASLGFVSAYNLNRPNDPPIEFHMAPLSPFAHTSTVTTLMVMNDMCVSGSRDGNIRIWKYDQSLNEGKAGFGLVHTLCGHAGEITDLAVTQNMFLWSCSTDKTIRLWDIAAGECKHLINKDTKNDAGEKVGHSDVITCLVTFENDTGSFVLSASLDGTIKVWNSSNGTCELTKSNGSAVNSMALSSDLQGNPILLCGTVHGEIMIRSVLPTKLSQMSLVCCLGIGEPNYTTGHDGLIKSVMCGPGNTFYTAGADGMVMVWQITADLGM